MSIKPKYADLILAGSKRVELRRSWPANDIGVMVLYASAPVQRLVGVAYINHINECGLNELWAVAEAYGGGVTYEELKDYVHGKKTAFGVMIERVEMAKVRVDPKELFQEFVPPQSFSYLSPADFQRTIAAMFP